MQGENKENIAPHIERIGEVVIVRTNISRTDEILSSFAVRKVLFDAGVDSSEYQP